MRRAPDRSRAGVVGVLTSQIRPFNGRVPTSLLASVAQTSALLPPADAPAQRPSACRAPWTTPRSNKPGAASDFAKDGVFTQLP